MAVKLIPSFWYMIFINTSSGVVNKQFLLLIPYKMNIRITSFANPFSFFCVADNFYIKKQTFENIIQEEYINASLIKSWMSDLHHGQYILVMWNSKWSRGIVDMGTQFLIWLIDYGMFIRPNEKTAFIDLPVEYRKYPTKVFEASIHGVVPMDMNLSDECQIKNQATTKWNQGSIDKAQELIKKAVHTYFNPLAILSTKFNDIVIGDLVLELPGAGSVNIIDQLEMWPVFLERNPEAYIKGGHSGVLTHAARSVGGGLRNKTFHPIQEMLFSELPHLYTTRRRHRGCLLKPDLQKTNIPTITLDTRLEEYDNIKGSNNEVSERGGSILSATTCVKDENAFKLTAEELEKYSQRYIKVSGRSYNVLTVLVNKARDLRMCDRYKDHDLKSIGRGSSYRR